MRRNAGQGLSVLVAVAAMIGGLAARAESVNYQLVTVGDAGNTADTTGFGAVSYEYRIGTYEVTIGEYTAFLNAVAKTDTYGLYTTSMATDLNVAGISRSGSSGSYTYSVINNGGSSANRPISYVSWFDAARFANWMQNGQGSGSTETGAYTLVNGQTSGTAPARNAGATFFIPTEDEWYKAAYYRGGGTNAGYWNFATQSNSAPGNNVGSSANNANYKLGGVLAVTQSTTYSSSQNYLTDAGAFSNSLSAYGTFDQSGNVSEWNDLTGVAGSSRGRRGDRWVTPDPFGLSRGFFEVGSPALEDSSIGFRLGASLVSAVPEIDASSFGMAFSCLLGGLALLDRRRVRAG